MSSNCAGKHFNHLAVRRIVSTNVAASRGDGRKLALTSRIENEDEQCEEGATTMRHESLVSCRSMHGALGKIVGNRVGYSEIAIRRYGLGDVSVSSEY